MSNVFDLELYKFCKGKPDGEIVFNWLRDPENEQYKRDWLEYTDRTLRKIVKDAEIKEGPFDRPT